MTIPMATVLATFSIFVVMKMGLERQGARSTIMSLTKSSSSGSISTSTNSTSFCVPPKPLRWEWNFYSDQDQNDNDDDNNGGGGGGGNNTHIITHRKHKNTLIALFCGYDKYSEMLEKTAPVTKAYGKMWKQDVVVLQGTSYILPDVDGEDCTPPGRRTTLNKITLAREAYARTFLPLTSENNDNDNGNDNERHSRRKYDQILILDTDAMIYNFDVDVSTLFPTNNKNEDDDMFMLAAHRVDHSKESRTTTMDGGKGIGSDRDDQKLQQQQQQQVHDAANINAGVLLWNLHHPETPHVLAEWGHRANKAIRDGSLRGDQKLLHQTLRSPRKSMIVDNTNSADGYTKSKDRCHLVTSPTPTDAFAYGHGSVIRHFIRRPDHQTWDDPTKQVEARNEKINNATRHVCETYLGYHHPTNMTACWEDSFDHVPYSSF